MAIKSKIRKTAQKEERICWENNKKKLNSTEYQKHKTTYRNLILKKAKIDPQSLANKKFLEIGCWPTWIFMIFNKDEKSKDYTLIDPLLDAYKKITPQYFGNESCISKPFEDIDSNKLWKQDIIFAINCIDHAKDMNWFLDKVLELCSSKTRFVLAVNTHKRNCTAKIRNKFQKILEPHHPYHFTQQDYENILKDKFNIINVIDVEDEIIEVNNQTRTLWKEKKSIKDTLYNCHPKNIFFNILKVFWYPPHDFTKKWDSIYRHKMFILTK